MPVVISKEAHLEMGGVTHYVRSENGMIKQYLNCINGLLFYNGSTVKLTVAHAIEFMCTFTDISYSVSH